MTSTSSSSSERITACAPVSCCGATLLGCGAGVVRVSATAAAFRSHGAPAPLVAWWVRSRVLPRSFSYRFVGSGATKNPRQLPLYEGCASMLGRLRPGYAPTRQPITTSNPGVSIAVDGSPRTGQRSNSGPRGRAGTGSDRTPRCEDGRVSSPASRRPPRSSSRSRRWPIWRSDSSRSPCSRWCSPSRRGSRRCWSSRSSLSAAIIRYRTVVGRDDGHRPDAAGQHHGGRGATSTGLRFDRRSWALARRTDGRSCGCRL